MNLQAISVLFPTAWGRPRILRAIHRLAAAFPGVPVDAHTGDTDAPCTDCMPMGCESIISRILMAGG